MENVHDAFNTTPEISNVFDVSALSWGFSPHHHILPMYLELYLYTLYTCTSIYLKLSLQSYLVKSSLHMSKNSLQFFTRGVILHFSLLRTYLLHSRAAHFSWNRELQSLFVNLQSTGWAGFLFFYSLLFVKDSVFSSVQPYFTPYPLIKMPMFFCTSSSR